MVNDDAGASYKSPVIFTGLSGRPRYDIFIEGAAAILVG
jgi:hypothetical protein